MASTATNLPARSSLPGETVARKRDGIMASIDESMMRIPAGLRAGLFFALVPLVGNLDLLTGEELSFSVFYLLPIALAARYQQGSTAYACAVFAGLVWLTVEMLSHSEFSSPFIPFWNSIGRTGFFLLLVAFMRVIAERDAWLEGEVRRHTAALREMFNARRMLEREMAQAVAREHSQIARELHDGVGQYLAGLAFQARTLADELRQSGSSHGERANGLVDKLALTNRMLRRLDHLFSPAIATEGGIAVALGRLAADVREFSGVECTLEVPVEPFVIGEFQALTLFRIAQEALNNSVKHSSTGAVRLALTVEESGLRLLVADDGRGFSSEADGEEGEGLRIMRHRAELIGARLQIRSATGSGCTVECILPWHGATPTTRRED